MDLATLGFLLFLLLLIGVSYFVFGSFLFGAGYQPAPRAVVTSMLDLAEVGPSDRLLDLGAGTGAIIFRAARERGASVVGVEVEPLRVALLRLRRRLGPGAERIRIRWGNLYSEPLTGATVVATFLWPEAMSRLKPRFERELAPGTRIVSHWHPIPGWESVREDPDHRVYLYRTPGRLGEPQP